MSTDLDRSSATIYQFPPRGRFAIGARSASPASAMMDALPRMPSPALGSGWYHEDAIREERTRKD